MLLRPWPGGSPANSVRSAAAPPRLWNVPVSATAPPASAPFQRHPVLPHPTRKSHALEPSKCHYTFQASIILCRAPVLTISQTADYMPLARLRYIRYCCRHQRMLWLHHESSNWEYCCYRKYYTNHPRLRRISITRPFLLGNWSSIWQHEKSGAAGRSPTLAERIRQDSPLATVGSTR